MTRGLVLLASLLLGLAQPASAAEAIKIGLLKFSTNGPTFIALEKGYFAAQGIDASLVYFDAAQPIAVAAVSGDIDVGVTGVAAGFYNLAGKGALTIIAAQSREEPGYPNNGILVSNRAWDSGLRSYKDFGGHSVAVTTIGAPTHYAIGVIADKVGVPLDTIRIVPLQTNSNQVSALIGGQVDAAVIPGTLAVPVIKRNDAHLLGWAGDEVAWQLGAIFVKKSMIAQRRKLLEAYIKAYRQGAREYYDAFLAKGPDGKVQQGPGAPALLAILSKYLGQPPEQVNEGLSFVDPDGRLLVKDIYRQVAWYQAHGMVDKTVDPAAILDLTFVDGHYDR
ncbi:MAG TPA: ABC transporter substrate-binding protein [Stellaceae bacterium]|nr:ABC transporter substrate-binding protein [Stellaceae bacterium]